MALPAPQMDAALHRPPVPEAAARDPVTAPLGHPLGGHEISRFWSVGAGQLDSLGVRIRLWQSWGWCARHTLGFLAVEASVERGWLYQPAVLYEELMQQAVRALAPHWLFGRARAEVALGGSRCPACEAGWTRDAEAEAGEVDLVESGGRLEPLLAYASETRPWWMPWVCGACAESGGMPLCRPHLLTALQNGLDVDLAAQRALVEEIAHHVETFRASFSWGRQGSETPVDRAALIGAAGWCAGWKAIREWIG